MIEKRLRLHFDDYLDKTEVVIYGILAVLLALASLAAIASAAKLLWEGLGQWAETFQVLNQLLIVLMLAEILHTVRISIRTHILFATEPFLVVGLIASVRRILVITLETAALIKDGTWPAEGQAVFRASMTELGLLALLVLILVFAITLLRRYAPSPSDPIVHESNPRPQKSSASAEVQANGSANSISRQVT